MQVITLDCFLKMQSYSEHKITIMRIYVGTKNREFQQNNQPRLRKVDPITGKSGNSLEYFLKASFLGKYIFLNEIKEESSFRRGC